MPAFKAGYEFADGNAAKSCVQKQLRVGGDYTTGDEDI
jgi:hypothetical protein